MALPSGVSLTDINAAIPIVTAAITRLNLGAGAANPGLQSTLAQSLGALNDMVSTSNPALYTAAQWQSFAAAMQTMSGIAATAGDDISAAACLCVMQVFATL